MNKLRFNEGGQPVFLNDLQLLQDNFFEVWDTILKLLANGEDVFVLDDYPYSVDQTVAGQKTMTFPAGIIVVRGELYAYEAASLTTTDIDAKPYVCLQNVTDDVRLFEDGQERPCRSIGRAYLSYDTTGVDEYYYFTDLVWNKTLPLLLKKKLDVNTIPWEDIPVTFYSGFSGKVQKRTVNGETFVRVNIKSTATSWSDPIAWETTNHTIYKLKNDEDYELLWFLKHPIVFNNAVESFCFANDMGCAFLLNADGTEVTHTPSGSISLEVKLL